MPSRIIAIGDIHGCAQALERLLRELQPNQDDIVVPLGDYIDRGPDSKGVIDQLLALENQTTLKPILGNHEEMMIGVVAGEMKPSLWTPHGGVETLDSYQFDGDLKVIPQSHVDFLGRCLDYVETDSHLFFHANYEADVMPAELGQMVLRWRSLEEAMPGPHKSGKVAVVGHTPDKYGEIMDVGYLKCLDTYCYGGQWLTAMNLLSGEIWQANDQGELR